MRIGGTHNLGNLHIDSSGYIDIQIPNTSKYILHGFLFPLGHSHVGFVDGESLDGSFHSKASAVHSACDLRPDAPNIGPASVLHVDGGLSSHPFWTFLNKGGSWEDSWNILG